MIKNIYSSKMNKRASARDPLLINFRLSKRGQFFILSAVIIASIIVSMASIKNFVATGDAPKKFYYYSQQLEDEAGAVVDYALYNDPTGDNLAVKANLNNFLQQSIDKTLEGYPNMEIFSCYTNATTPSTLICQNNGTRSVKVNTTSAAITLAGTIEKPFYTLYGKNIYYNSTGSIYVGNAGFIRVNPNGSKSYEIILQSSSVQRGQFYFLLKMNTTAGDYVASSEGTKLA